MLSPTEEQQEWVTEPWLLYEWGGSRSEAQWRPQVAGAQVVPCGLAVALGAVPAPRLGPSPLQARRRRRGCSPPTPPALAHLGGLPAHPHALADEPPRRRKNFGYWTLGSAKAEEGSIPLQPDIKNVSGIYCIYNIYYLYSMPPCQALILLSTLRGGYQHSSHFTNGQTEPPGEGFTNARLGSPHLRCRGSRRAGPAPPTDQS